MFKRWYDKTAIENFRSFIEVYGFGFTPKVSMNISAAKVSPLNEIIKKRYPNIDIRNTYRSSVDIKNMPYDANSIDILITEVVLEHVSQVWKAPPEIYRVLKVGGLSINHVPFMYPEHGVDYYRFTRAGLRDLFSLFEVADLGCAGHQEITNFLMKYRTNHPKLKEFEAEDDAANKVFADVGYGDVGNLCSNCVWGYFRKGN